MMTVPHAPTSAALTRRRLAEGLAGAPEDLVDDALLVITELVGNAVLHARPLRGEQISVGWKRRTEYVELWVTDGGSETDRPTPRHPGPHESHGRGLAVVDAISASWGVQRDTASATVWARIALPDREEPGSDGRRADLTTAAGRPSDGAGSDGAWHDGAWHDGAGSDGAGSDGAGRDRRVSGGRACPHPSSMAQAAR